MLRLSYLQVALCLPFCFVFVGESLLSSATGIPLDPHYLLPSFLLPSYQCPNYPFHTFPNDTNQLHYDSLLGNYNYNNHSASLDWTYSPGNEGSNIWNFLEESSMHNKNTCIFILRIFILYVQSFYLPVHLCTTYMQCPWRPEGCVRSLETGDINGCEPPGRSWESNPGPL